MLLDFPLQSFEQMGHQANISFYRPVCKQGASLNYVANMASSLHDILPKNVFSQNVYFAL